MDGGGHEIQKLIPKLQVCTTARSLTCRIYFTMNDKKNWSEEKLQLKFNIHEIVFLTRTKHNWSATLTNRPLQNGPLKSSPYPCSLLVLYAFRNADAHARSVAILLYFESSYWLRLCSECRLHKNGFLYSVTCRSCGMVRAAFECATLCLMPVPRKRSFKLAYDSAENMHAP